MLSPLDPALWPLWLKCIPILCVSQTFKDNHKSLIKTHTEGKKSHNTYSHSSTWTTHRARCRTAEQPASADHCAEDCPYSSRYQDPSEDRHSHSLTHMLPAMVVLFFSRCSHTSETKLVFFEWLSTVNFYFKKSLSRLLRHLLTMGMKIFSFEVVTVKGKKRFSRGSEIENREKRAASQHPPIDYKYVVYGGKTRKKSISIWRKPD